MNSAHSTCMRLDVSTGGVSSVDEGTSQLSDFDSGNIGGAVEEEPG